MIQSSTWVENLAHYQRMIAVPTVGRIKDLRTFPNNYGMWKGEAVKQ